MRRRWHPGDLDIPKTEASRRIREIGPLAGELLRLARGKKSHEFLFARADGNPPDDRDLQHYVFRPAAKAVDLLRGFRNAYVPALEHLVAAGRGSHAVRGDEGCGHTSPSMTWLYTVTDPDREREQVRRIWNRLSGKSEGPVN